MRPAPEELKTFTNEDLEGLRNDVVGEQQRRTEVALLPEKIDLLVQQYVNQGGDTAKIKNPNSYIKGPKTPPRV